MIRSVTLRRALLTTSTRAARSTKRPATSVPFPNAHFKFYNPTLTTRNFQTTAIMSATADKGGVHNLLDKKSFDHAVAEKDTLMVLDCFATWCGPCKVIAPQVVKFSEEFPQAKFYKVDVDEVPDVASELGIRAMPTFLLFKNGERVGEVVGANPKALLAAIQGNL